MDYSKYPHICPFCQCASYNDPVWGKIYCTNVMCEKFDKTITEEEEKKDNPWDFYRMYDQYEFHITTNGTGRENIVISKPFTGWWFDSGDLTPHGMQLCDFIGVKND